MDWYHRHTFYRQLFRQSFIHFTTKYYNILIIIKHYTYCRHLEWYATKHSASWICMSFCPHFKGLKFSKRRLHASSFLPLKYRQFFSPQWWEMCVVLNFFAKSYVIFTQCLCNDNIRLLKKGFKNKAIEPDFTMTTVSNDNITADLIVNDVRALATSYKMYKIGRWLHICKILKNNNFENILGS